MWCEAALQAGLPGTSGGAAWHGQRSRSCARCQGAVPTDLHARRFREAGGGRQSRAGGGDTRRPHFLGRFTGRHRRGRAGGGGRGRGRPCAAVFAGRGLRRKEEPVGKGRLSLERRAKGPRARVAAGWSSRRVLGGPHPFDPADAGSSSAEGDWEPRGSPGNKSLRIQSFSF